MRRKVWLGLAGWLALAAMAPARAWAGGNEYAGNGARSIGRGGTNLARADNPHVMVHNPALLADLWGNQAYLNLQIGVPDSCFRPTGAYGWGVDGTSAVQIRDQVMATSEFDREPYPEVCYEGGPLLHPSLVFSFKPTDDLGLGIGFFPPSSTRLGQWAGRDGAIDTENGPRPAPTRYMSSHLNVTYFSLLAGVGYRLADWIRVGAGFQWTLVVLEAFKYSNERASRDPVNDVRSEVLGRDLFIPGFTASVHLVPHDNLDIVLGFRWMDRLKTDAELLATPGAWGTGQPTTIDGTPLSSSIPTTSVVDGRLDSTPVVTPKLSFGIRYADRVEPRDYEGSTGEGLPESTLKDSMETENWDIEFNAVYHLHSAYDFTDFTIPKDETVWLTGVQPDGSTNRGAAEPGRCLGLATKCKNNHSLLYYGGTDQWSLRLGGDYNVIRGKLALRGGVSYETRGVNPNDAFISNAPFERLGAHAGLTWRIDPITDFTFGYAHYFQETIAVDPHPSSGQGQLGPKLEEFNVVAEGEADGVADIEVINGNNRFGPYFANAGKHKWALDLFSVSVTRHF